MKNLPLADEMPYQFYAPKLRPLLMRAGQFYLDATLRKQYRVEVFDVEGMEHVTRSWPGVMVSS